MDDAPYLQPRFDLRESPLQENLARLGCPWIGEAPGDPETLCETLREALLRDPDQSVLRQVEETGAREKTDGGRRNDAAQQHQILSGAQLETERTQRHMASAWVCDAYQYSAPSAAA